MKKTILSAFLPAMALFTAAPDARSAADDIPEIPREFRAVWIATVSNIDWPSERTLGTEEQKTELIAQLDTAAAMNLNAIVFQVRPMFDALYESNLEPWSEYLTGEMGKAPEPYYDPLAFIIEESHKRGLELHAWFNPYRARHASARSELAKSHVSHTDPEIVREYGNYLWTDPTEELTKRKTLDVILDVVRRYNVDGVHIDDYFYPYRSYADGAEFPDHAAWKRYQESGGEMSRSDWRREHVNDFVERFYREVKAEDPLVKVGISPFGIWRPGHPEGIQGLDQYESLFADAKLWLNKGWVDYFTPQLYWPMDREAQSYVRLLEWWVEQNHENRHVWPGNYINNIRPGGTTSLSEEIVNQIEATRAQEGAGGNVLFSARGIMQNPDGLTDKLAAEPYAQPALVPASPWLSDTPPSKPELNVATDNETDETVATWNANGDDQPRLWVVNLKENGSWSYRILAATENGNRSLSIENATEIAVAAIDRAGNQSEWTWQEIP